ncbi:MAG TPA: hypothetical protein ENI68_07480 [Gammaproteobacteria bacterium]|nr:hypothetical protein [Gammaproteobacteria bacterium]
MSLAMNQKSEDSVFENNPFIDGLFEWMDSPRGQLSDEVREAAWHRLGKVEVDITHRKLVWEDGRRLSIGESVQRIQADYPDFPVELLETHLISSPGSKWNLRPRPIPKNNWTDWIGSQRSGLTTITASVRQG